MAAVADDGEGLACFDALTGSDNEGAGAEVGIVAVFAILVLDGDEVTETAALGILPLSAIKRVDDATAHGGDTAAAAQTDRSDIPSVQTAAPVGGAAVGALGDHPLFASGGGKRVTLLTLDEEPGGCALCTIGILDDDPIFAWCQARRIAGGDATGVCGLGRQGSDELPGIGGAIDRKMDDAPGIEPSAIELDISFRWAAFDAADTANGEALCGGGIALDGELAFVKDKATGHDADAPLARFGGLFKASQGHLGDEAHQGCRGELFVIEELHHLRTGGEPLYRESANARATGEQEAKEDLAFCIVDGGDRAPDGAAVFAGR